MCLFGYSYSKKGYKCFHPPSKNSVSRDVTFHEDQNYFNHPYLQGESLWEDKENNFDPLVLPTLELNSCDLYTKT